MRAMNTATSAICIQDVQFFFWENSHDRLQGTKGSVALTVVWCTCMLSIATSWFQSKSYCLNGLAMVTGSYMMIVLAKTERHGQDSMSPLRVASRIACIAYYLHLSLSSMSSLTHSYLMCSRSLPKSPCQGTRDEV